MIKTVLVDNEYAVRKGLRKRLELEPDIKIIGEARNARQGIELIKILRPDLVIIELCLPVIGGIEAIQLIQMARSEPENGCQVIILTISDTPASRQAALRAGATAFVSKYEPQQMLLNAIRSFDNSYLISLTNDK